MTQARMMNFGCNRALTGKEPPLRTVKQGSRLSFCRLVARWRLSVVVERKAAELKRDGRPMKETSAVTQEAQGLGVATSEVFTTLRRMDPWWLPALAPSLQEVVEQGR